MAIGKRRTRPLSFGSHRLRWRCEFSHPSELSSVGYQKWGSSWPQDVLVVRPEEGSHRLLTVTWPACKGPLVTPGLVRACAEEALRRGWLAKLAVLELAGTDIPTDEAGSD